MLTPWDKLKIKMAVSLGWSIKGKMPEAIRAFQATEADGVWHLHRGLARLDDPKLKAILFSHSLEEESHAEEFAHTYHEYADQVMTPAAYERKDLYSEYDAPWKIFAFVHVGEQDATDRFRYIRNTLREGALKKSLEKIVEDEEGHVDLTHRMLVKMGATDSDIKNEVLRVRLTRLWEQWLRTGKRVVDSIATLMLSIAYYLMGPFLFLAARRKLAHRFVEYDNNQIKKL
ncbi:MAG: ferritin-like domain-containing protein [Byssovorax sp.]